MNTLTLAQHLLDTEFEDFTHNPVGYVVSMGWDKEKYADVGRIKDEVAPTADDFLTLEKIIIKFINESDEEKVSVMDICESNAVSDFLCNCVAEKINALFETK